MFSTPLPPQNPNPKCEQGVTLIGELKINFFQNIELY